MFWRISINLKLWFLRTATGNMVPGQICCGPKGEFCGQIPCPIFLWSQGRVLWIGYYWDVHCQALKKTTGKCSLTNVIFWNDSLEFRAHEISKFIVSILPSTYEHAVKRLKADVLLLVKALTLRRKKNKV